MYTYREHCLFVNMLFRIILNYYHLLFIVNILVYLCKQLKQRVMKLIKRYTALQVETNTSSEVVEVNLTYGAVSGYYDSIELPKKSHDTEQEAIEWAYKENKWARWIVLPVYTFDNL